MSMLKHLLHMSCLLLFAWSSVSLAATATVDRNPVSINEDFRLTVEVSGDANSDPDFSVLDKDFEVLGSSQGQQFQFINGQSSHTRQWTLTLMAKNTGELTIPPITVGQEKTEAIGLQVLPADAVNSRSDTAQAGQQNNLMIEVVSSAEEVYVNSQFILSVRIMSRIPIVAAELSNPEPAGVPVIMDVIGEDRNYTTTVNGQRYEVVERSYAISPQEAGGLSIPPLLFQARVQTRSSDPFDIFSRGNDIRRMRSEPVQVKVLPAPDMPAGQYWLPVEQLTLAQAWSEDAKTMEVGQPVTRTVSMIAVGIGDKQLPDFPEATIPGVGIYPDRAELTSRVGKNGVTSSKRQDITYIPSRPGNYALPTIEIPWWDTVEKQWKTASLPGKTITVAAAAGKPASTPAAQQVSLDNDAGPEQEATGGPTLALSSQSVAMIDNPFFWTTIFFAAAWLATVFMAMRRRTPRAQDTQAQKNVSAIRPKVSVSRIRQAYENNDQAAAVSALLEWGAAIWPHDPPANLGALAKRVDAQSAQWIMKLESARYSKHPENWRGKPYWEKLKPRHDEQSTDTDSVLEKMVP